MNPDAIAALLLVLAWKSTVVLALGLLAMWSLRRASAAVRHSLWTVAVAALLAIPLLELSTPRLTAHVPAGLTTSTVMPIAMRPLNGSPTLPAARTAPEVATPAETPEAAVQPEDFHASEKKWSTTDKTVAPKPSEPLPTEPTLSDVTAPVEPAGPPSEPPA